MKNEDKNEVNFIFSPIKYIKIFFNFFGIYFIWILLHYIASHLYIKLCVPNTFFGLLISPFLSTTPYCISLRWLIENGANNINNMWIFLGTWLCSYLSSLHKN
jgi:hypothetical protein